MVEQACAFGKSARASEFSQNFAAESGSLSGSVATWFLFKTMYSATSRRLAIAADARQSPPDWRPDQLSDCDCKLRELDVMWGSDDYQPALLSGVCRFVGPVTHAT